MPSTSLPSRITHLFSSSSRFQSLCEEISKEQQRRAEGSHHHSSNFISLSGLAGGSVAFLLAALHQRLDHNILFVAGNFEDGQSLADDLSNIIGEEAVCYFPLRQITLYEFNSPTGEIIGQRLAALAGMMSGQKRVVVAPAEAIIEPTIAKATFLAESLRLTIGQKLEPEELAGRLVALGFNRVPAVEEVGDFAVRGGLIDFFSPSSELPIRAEFIDDEIESLRLFDVRDQRTVERLDNIDLLPRREVPIRSETLESYLERLPERDADLIRARFISEPELPGLEWLAVSFGIMQGSLLDYLSNDDLVVLDGGRGLREMMKDHIQEGQRQFERARTHLVAPPPVEQYYRNPDSQFQRLLSSVALDIQPFRSQQTSSFDLHCREHPAVGSRLDYLAELTQGYRASGIHTVITCDNAGQAARLGEILVGRGIDVPIEVFHIHSGFVSDELKIALLTDHQIFSRRFRRIKRRRYKEGVALTSYTNLNPGDIVVHADYGLGRFLKLETIIVDDRPRDCLLLAYQDGDRLYVPIEEFNRVSKYAGKEATPKLTNLGSPAWLKLKSKTKKALADMAAELIRLYAERKMRPGFQFASDTVWQRQMEASFPYEETPDQFKAIEDVKRDMESPSPGDRLVCGDVGYGKTEVAVRAAFKAVENGKQVAVLVPTTILAQQHFGTFSSRLKEFPMKVAMLSRFKTRAEQKEIIDQVAAASSASNRMVFSICR